MKRLLKWIGGMVLLTIAALLAIGYAPDTDPAAMRKKYASATSQFIDVGGGLTMHLRDEGKRDGPTLVLLHGSSSSLHTWEPWVARLGAKYRIISLDQIGHGLTGPNPSGDYTAKAVVSTLDAAMAKLGVAKFALAGNSAGGWAAWEYTLVHPDKVTKLILIDAGGPPDDGKRSLPLGFRILLTPGVNLLANIITPRSIIAKSVHQTISNQAIVTEAMIDRYWELNRYPGNRNASRLRFAEFANRGLHADQLGEIKVPTLILWGGEDKLIPVSGAGWFAARIKGSQKIVYSGIGHLPMEEAADQSAKDADAFLSLPFAAKPL